MQNEEVFYVSKRTQAFKIFIAVFLIIVGIILLGRGRTVRGLCSIIPGALLLIPAIKNLRDKSTKLSISPEGIWTEKLGYVSWESVMQANIVADAGSREKKLLLQLFLKDGNPRQPDDRIPINDLVNFQHIQVLIDSHFNYRQTAIQA